MKDVAEIVKGLFDHLEPHQFGLNFYQLGIDSFDLLELRVRLENEAGRRIPDTLWVTFESFQNIQDYYQGLASAESTLREPTGLTSRRRVRINMPQMVLGGLSENWLFKELGDVHWGMVCEALQCQSHNVLDELNNRLYATFVRVRLVSSHHLKAFRENEELEFTSTLSRFGKSMFFSDVFIQADQKEIRATLMTTFSVRQSDNKNLLKGEPSIPPNSEVIEMSSLPDFGEEYREMRRGNRTVLSLGGHNLRLDEGSLFETDYELNPYQDVNGVNLLYFAAYPTINDVCEARFVHDTKPETVARFWVAEASTVARDVFYYGNSDLDDRIVFRVNSCELSSDERFTIVSSLFRKSDGQRIANVFTVKEIHG